jgi:hypothetical protein
MTIDFRIPLTLLLAVLTTGCGEARRPDRNAVDLVAARQRDDVDRDVESTNLLNRMVDATRKKQNPPATTGPTTATTAATAPTVLPAVDLLVISGGGDWGAFGAGVLKGWGRVKGDLARPRFDVVTGVSTGALIAPFAFLGDDESIERVVQFYRNPRSDWAKPRGMLYFLPHNPSFFSLPGLERDLKRAVDLPMLERIVAEGDGGRELIVNTTNVDYGDIRPWDVVDASRAAIAKRNPGRVQRILLASAGVPGVFPSQMIDDSLYVDGAITSNILYGGQVSEDRSFWAVWQRKYPEAPLPRMRYWVIFNNQLRFPPQVTQQRWPNVIGRATIMSTQSATVNSMRHLYAIAEIARLKRGAEVEVRVMSVPDDWVPPEPGVFQKKVMNELADMGERMGADPSSWRTEPP